MTMTTARWSRDGIAVEEVLEACVRLADVVETRCQVDVVREQGAVMARAARDVGVAIPPRENHGQLADPRVEGALGRRPRKTDGQSREFALPWRG
jgi:hypothetical protein